jgi:hypothetical protein
MGCYLMVLAVNQMGCYLMVLAVNQMGWYQNLQYLRFPFEQIIWNLNM